MSTIVTLTAISSFIGFVLNSAVLYLVLSRGRRKYHYLFAGILLICAVWDLSITITMLRNEHPGDLILLGKILNIVCIFLLPLIFHFTCSYINRPYPKTTAILWAMTTIMAVLWIFGIGGKINDVYHYSWGNIWKGDQIFVITTWLAIPLWILNFSVACWLLYGQIKRESSQVTRRHLLYVLVGFMAIGLAVVKVLVVVGVDVAFLLPMGMAFNDLFVALIGIAIIKERLFDITLVLKKGALYSALGAGIILIFSISEHMLATYIGEFLGEESFIIHIISIAVVIAILMPVKHWLERIIEGYFHQKQFEF
jgi:hypothetical protein